MDYSQGTTQIRAFSSVTEEMPNSDRGGLITGLAIDSNHNILAVDNQAKVVKVFNQMGQYKYCFGENILKSPWDVFITTSGKIAVSDPGDADIKVFSKSGKYLLRSEKGHHLNLPHGIDYHPWSKETVIADRGFSCVYVHNPKGEVKDMITKQDEEYGLGSPNYACFDYAGNIYLTDIEDQSLIAYDTDRNHLFTYGHPNCDDGNEDIELNNPGSVIVDRFNNILLADTGNCRVHLIDKNGKLKDYLLTWEDGLGEPQAMTLTEDGSLIISESNTGMVKMFSYLHLPIVNEIKICTNGQGEFDVQSINSGPSLHSDSDDEELFIKNRSSSLSVKGNNSGTKNENFTPKTKDPIQVKERQNSAHEFRKKLQSFSVSNTSAKSKNNFSKSAGFTFNSNGYENAESSKPVLKGILKKSGKPTFDFFKPKDETDNEKLCVDIIEGDISQSEINESDDTITKLLDTEQKPSANISMHNTSQRDVDNYSAYSRTSSSLPKSAGSNARSINSRSNSSNPWQKDVMADRIQSASTIKSCDTRQSDKSDIPVVIIDKVPNNSAITKLNLNLKSTSQPRPRKTSVANSTVSKASLKSHKSSTSIASIGSKTSKHSTGSKTTSRSQKFSAALSIDNNIQRKGRAEVGFV